MGLPDREPQNRFTFSRRGVGKMAVGVAAGVAALGFRPARGQEAIDIAVVQKTAERTLSAAEQMLVENTQLLGSKSYALGNDRVITVDTRVGVGSPVFFGLQGSDTEDNPNPIPGVPDLLTPEAANMFSTTGQFRQVNHLTLVTLKPGDSFFNQLPMNRTFAPTAYNPEDGSPSIRIAQFGAELTDDGNLTFVIQPVTWEPNNPERVKGNKKIVAETISGALINGGQNGFLPIEFTNVQNRSIVAIRANFDNIVQISPG